MNSIFKEDNGNLSHVRIFSAVIVLTVLFNWTWPNVMRGEYLPLDLNAVILGLGAMGAKVTQKWGEK